MAPPIVAFKRRLAGLGDGLVDLTQAVPSYEPPPPVAASLVAAAASPHAMRYTQDPGLDDVRAAIAGYLRRRHGAVLTAEEILVTPGANAAFHFVANVLAGVGERVFVLSPYYFNHVMSLQLLGCDIEEVRLPGAVSVSRALEAGALDRVATGGVLVVVNPSNPTGRALDRHDVAALALWAASRDVRLVMDETYLEFFPRDEEPASLLALPTWREQSVVIGSFSKSLAVSGLRIGYLVADREVVDEVLKVHDSAAVCAPHPAQLAVCAALEWPGIDTWLSERREEIDARVRAFTDALVGTPGPFALETAGAFFAYVRAAPGTRPRDETARADAYAFAELVARRAQVACLPGSAFGANEADALRIAVGNLDREMAADAARRLQAIGR